MKKLYILFLLSFSAYTTLAQTAIFQYDDAGNRTKRTASSGCDFAVDIPATSNNISPTMGQQMTLAATCVGSSCNDVTYTWRGINNINTTGIVSPPFFAPGASGQYYYSVAAAKPGCETKNDTLFVNVQPGGTNVLTNGCYKIAIFGKNLQPETDATGAAIKLYAPTSNSNQIFQLTGVDGDSYKVLSTSANKIWEAVTPFTLNSGINLRDWTNAQSQKWYVSSTGAANTYLFAPKSAPVAAAGVDDPYDVTNGYPVTFRWDASNAYLQSLVLTSTTCPAAPSCNFAISIPSSNNLTPTMGQQTSLTAACTGPGCTGVTYTWSGMNLSGTGATSPNFYTPASTAGNHKYRVTGSKAGCTSVKDSVILNVQAGGSYVLANGCYTIGTYGVLLQPETSALSATLRVYPPSGSNSQIFNITGVDGDSYKILSATSGLTLNPVGNVAVYPGGVIMKDWGNTTYQKWYISPYSSAGYQITNKSNTALVAELGGGSAVSGNAIKFSTNIAGGHQRFAFTSVTCPTLRIGLEDIVSTNNVETQVTFYPNPVKDKVYIKVSNSPAFKQMRMFTLGGTLIHETRQLPIDGIDMSQFGSGVYLVKISLSNGLEEVYKVVKE